MTNTYTGTSYAEADRFLNTARSEKYRNQRNIGNNTRMHRNDDGSIGIVYHATEIVTYYADGTTRLNTGGWDTITTKQRINRYTQAQVWSGPMPGKGSILQVGVVSHTQRRERQCAGCHGVPFDDSQQARRLLAFRGLHLKDDCDSGKPWGCGQCVRPCGRCMGTGRETVGGRAIGTAFHDGIVVDSEGQVIE